MKRVQNKELVYLAYVRRESQLIHHTYDDERHIYELIQRGDPTAASLGYEKFTGPHNGTLSRNPLRNKQYLFVVETAQAARACIQGGMPYQTAYDLSDLYIQKADECNTVEDLNDLYLEMVSDYIKRMKAIKSRTIDSKPVKQCIDYICGHLHEKITVPLLAEYVGLNPNYLSVLFKKVMKCTVSDYIRAQKLDTAKNMLKYSEFSILDICSLLALGSQSHFTEILKADSGLTPKQYRDRYCQEKTTERLE